MKEAGELGWLRLTDKSNLVLTSLHVLQHQDRGIFGERGLRITGSNSRIS